MSEYFDIDGNPTTLYRLVRTEPDWAISRIQESTGRIAELEQKYEYLKSCQEEYLKEPKLIADLEAELSTCIHFRKKYKEVCQVNLKLNAENHRYRDALEYIVFIDGASTSDLKETAQKALEAGG